MSFPAKGEQDRNENEDDNFIWQDYLDMTHTAEVPQVLFSHVEQSLQTGLQEGMMLEVPNKTNPDSYWIACINMVCGPLLRLRHVGQEDNRSNDFWCDLTKVNVHPLGWCNSEDLDLVPPVELKEKLTDAQSLVNRVLQQGESVPPELLTGDGFTPVDRIKQGMKVEIQDKMDPYRLWFATIIENVGGRLLLRHDTPDSLSPDFWLFYNSPRIFRIGWAAEQGFPYVLKQPSCIKTAHSSEEWEAVKEMANADAKQMPLPPDIFQNVLPAKVHNFEVGMKLEAIHPHNMAEICPATVISVIDSYYFLVKIDSNNSSDSERIESSWLCSAQHPYIFPIGWAQSHGLQLTHPSGWTTSRDEFDWQEYLSCTNAPQAPASCFLSRPSATELGFEVGMKLEAVNLENQHQICAASITRIIDNLLWIHLDSHDSFHPSHVVSMDSIDIFPVGWCETNLYPMKPPQQYQSQMKMQQVKEPSPKKETVGSTTTGSQQRSCWCPKIYFNHKCFSGPFLSKGKLAQLPKAVGPGPVTLVMREVLGMLISVAYKSSRVLKELQCDSKPEPGMHLEVLKAKYKNNTYRASVAVVTSADQVTTFCKLICERLQVCPFMFGPVSIGENNCPENCNTLSKTRFTQYWVQGKRKIGRPKGEASNLIPRPKKKRGRKRLIQNTKPDNNGTKDAGNADKEVAKSVTDKEEDTSMNIDNENKQNLGNSNENGAVTSLETTNIVRRRYRKKEFPKSAIKTRGAKLPNFALQIKASHWPHKRLVISTNESTIKTEKTPELPLSPNESIESQKSNLGDLNEVLQDSKSEPMETSNISEDLPSSKTLPSLPADIMELESNPLYWSEDDVYQYLMKTEDCAWIAQKCKEEMIDGQAFMMLNLPTLKEHLFLKTTAALKLCGHIERVKLAYYLRYVAASEP